MTPMVFNSTLVELADYSFGPVSSNRDFDFSLTFEKSVLSVITSVLVLSLAPLRLFYLLRDDSKTTPGRNYVLKLVFSALYLFRSSLPGRG
jgi:ATP-binding cassette subfamily C (CFTR/MRP) protein 1